MSSRLYRFLLGYAALLSTALPGYFIVGQVAASQQPSFDEMDVKRINVREEDGTLRMVISNTKRFPRDHQQGQRASTSQPQDRRHPVLQ
jgi:hypothetical protein